MSYQLVRVFFINLFIARIPAMQFSLDLVHRDIWSNVSAPLADFLNCSNVINIVIMQTGGSGCEKLDKCLKILRELQKQVNTINV